MRRYSVDLPGGSVKTELGEVLLRTEGQAYSGDEYARLPLLTRPDGTSILLSDVATVVDGFEDIAVAGNARRPAQGRGARLSHRRPKRDLRCESGQ